MNSKKTPKQCEHCGQTFLARLDNIKRGWVRFCSRNCLAKYRAAPCGHAGLLRDAREWVERCRHLLRCHDYGEDALAAQECLDRIDAALAGSAIAKTKGS